MKKLLSIILILLLTTGMSWSQQPRRQLERIHAAKMAYITDRLRLSSDQSSNFIPLYNEYEKEVRQTRQSFLGKYKNGSADRENDAVARRFVDDNLDYQQRVIEIKRKYNDQFLRIISPQQLADLYQAEREFRQMLMKRLEERRNGGRFR
jgi:hypothetical protein